jgi:hypothetical protein
MRQREIKFNLHRSIEIFNFQFYHNPPSLGGVEECVICSRGLLVQGTQRDVSRWIVTLGAVRVPLNRPSVKP